MISFQIEHKNLQLKIKRDNQYRYIFLIELYRELYADKKRLQQIILNLLSNAIKFTALGTIKFKFWEKPPFFYFSVSDTGVGIEENDIPKLFLPFGMIQNTKNINKYGKYIYVAI